MWSINSSVDLVTCPVQLLRGDFGEGAHVVLISLSQHQHVGYVKSVAFLLDVAKSVFDVQTPWSK